MPVLKTKSNPILLHTFKSFLLSKGPEYLQPPLTLKEIKTLLTSANWGGLVLDAKESAHSF